MKYARASSVALAGVLMLALAGCSGGQTPASQDCVPAHKDLGTISAGTLTIGVTDAPPLSSTVGEKGYSGLDADILDGFAKTECLTVTPVSGAVSAMIPGIEQARWDTALGGWYRTKARAEILTPSDPTYLDTLVIVSKEGLGSISDLEGKKVGTHDGTVVIEDLKKVLGDDLALYPSPLNVEQDLKAGRIEAALAFGLEASVVYKTDGYKLVQAKPDDRVKTTLEPGQTAIHFNKSANTLRAAFNDYLAKIKKDGTLASDLKKYGFDPSIGETGEPRLMK